MEINEKYMRRAIQLAAQGAGHASPNPMVGAVIVHDGRIIGEGFHRCCGKGHAEVNAVASVSDADRALLPESTIYVSLEPCSHYGKTPPCARLLIDVGIRRVVVGTLDPFDLVSGRGVAMLRNAGAEVVVGVLEDECRELNRRFFTAHTTGLPWVQLKWAQTADGFIALLPGAQEHPLHISTAVTLALMHRERAMADAIVVGARTVVADDPSLTTRLWPGSSPLRVVLDRNLSVAAGCRLFTDGLPTIVYNALKDGTEGSVTYVKLDTSRPDTWLRDLYRRGVTSVMVEGGKIILDQMLAAGAWDEVRLEHGTRTVAHGVEAPACVPARDCRMAWADGNLIATCRNQVKKV